MQKRTSASDDNDDAGASPPPPPSSRRSLQGADDQDEGDKKPAAKPSASMSNAEIKEAARNRSSGIRLAPASATSEAAANHSTSDEAAKPLPSSAPQAAGTSQEKTKGELPAKARRSSQGSAPAVGAIPVDSSGTARRPPPSTNTKPGAVASSPASAGPQKTGLTNSGGSLALAAAKEGEARILARPPASTSSPDDGDDSSSSCPTTAGAIAIEGPRAGMPPPSLPSYGEDDQETAIDNLVAAKPVDEEDMEAQVQERLRDETQGIAEEIQQELLQGVAHAEEVEQAMGDDINDQDKNETVPFWKQWPFIVLVLLIAIGAVVGIVVGVTGGGGESGDDKDDDEVNIDDTIIDMPVPTASPVSIAPTCPTYISEEDQNDLVRYLQGLLRESLPGSRIMNPSSIQYRTAEWLALEDPSGLVNETCFDETAMLERFVGAYVYFSTGGESSWIDSFGFLSEKSICEWNDEVLEKGIFCDDLTGYVQHLRLCK